MSRTTGVKKGKARMDEYLRWVAGKLRNDEWLEAVGRTAMANAFNELGVPRPA
jgi:hypothetical protein